MKRKEALREEILALRDQLSLEDRIEKSKRIADKVIQHKKFKEADKVLLFASFRSEVDTAGIFQAALDMGKKVYFPRVEGKEIEFYHVEKMSDLVEGYRGIYEPQGGDDTRFDVVWNVQTVEKESRILVIMPGVAFDEDGNRIGYGGGYYDKFLQKLERNIKKENLFQLAIAFDCQLVPKKIIEAEIHDKKPDAIVSESRLWQI